jgi:hypothetical protein
VAAAVFAMTLAGMGRSLCSCFQCVRRLNTVKKHCRAGGGSRRTAVCNMQRSTGEQKGATPT